MIVKPEAMDFSDKKFSMILYGSPGVAKTTLALSAPRPILFDFDRGVSRVMASHRKPTSMCDVYEEVLKDIHDPMMQDFETVIFDTGGSFITLLKDWAVRQGGKNVTKGGSISQGGYGTVKTEFASITDEVKTVLKKNVIYVFHSVEGMDKDGNPIQRLMCEGATKNTVWTPCDFGGYVQMLGNQRVICFTPEQEFFAKGCHGITGQIAIPTVGPNDKNDFLTRLFDKAKANIAAENEAFAPVKAQYDAVMQEARAIIDSVTDADTAIAAVASLKALNHALTSQKEASAMLKAKANSLGLIFTRDGGCVPKNAPTEQTQTNG